MIRLGPPKTGKAASLRRLILKRHSRYAASGSRWVFAPRVAYENTARSLASLRSLHLTLAGEVLRANNSCGDKGQWNDWRARRVRDLTNVFVAIVGATSKPIAGDDDGEDTRVPQDGGDKPGRATPLETAAGTGAAPK